MINKPNMKGFTLVETLVAVLLLSFAISGPLTIASKGLTATLVAKDQFTGFYLAQDAMEYVRFLRDSSCLASASGPSGCPDNVWLSSLSACVSADGSTNCYVDSLGHFPDVPTVCSGVCPTLRYDTTNRYFNYSGALPLTPQKFIRTVSIQNDPTGATPDEAMVTVTVSWTDRVGVTRVPVTVRESIFRWQ
jgi:prepilin-type N-terminal cleavage/methylation domain-containing protein